MRLHRVRNLRDLKPSDVGRRIEISGSWFPATHFAGQGVLTRVEHFAGQGVLTRVEHFAPGRVQLGIRDRGGWHDMPWPTQLACHVSWFRHRP